MLLKYPLDSSRLLKIDIIKYFVMIDVQRGTKVCVHFIVCHYFI